jgi:hypothetical protein
MPNLEMPAKKTIIYVVIFILIIGATAFVLYKNHQMNNQSALLLENSAKPLNPELISIEGGGDALDNLDIFQNEKFLNLKEYSTMPVEPAPIGKRDPFEAN